jgi:tetratricopeptide (TPR) repeat protein
MGLAKITRTLLLLASLLAWSGAAYADKIVLKNGRKITASNVVEDGDKVRYETAAGQLTLPRSIVDHIEKGGFTPDMDPRAAVSDLEISPPSVESSAAVEIDRDAVHDGSIDREYIAKLEGLARSGSVTDNNGAAFAHHAASQFELSRGDMEHALADERTALIYAPEQPLLLMNVAYLHLRRSEYKEALVYLDRARRVAPDDADVLKLAGWCYYGMNKMDKAVSEWQRALAIRPDAQVKAALDKAARDKQEEEQYKTNESAHFALFYNGEAEPALAREVLRTLESHFSRIESELKFTPPDSIGVVLYTRQAFADITRAPAWMGAFNDGRIRIPVQGLSGVTAELSRVLKHELTHSFVQQKTHGLAPTWIQEGIAQWMEGTRSDENAASLVQIYAAGHAEPLAKLEGSWMSLSSDKASYAYAWGLANIEYIVQADGMQDVQQILDRIAGGSSTEEALREVLHSGYGDLMDSTAGYLRKNYVQ